MDENNNVLSKADLQQIVERASGNLAQLMAKQKAHRQPVRFCGN